MTTPNVVRVLVTADGSEATAGMEDVSASGKEMAESVSASADVASESMGKYAAAVEKVTAAQQEFDDAQAEMKSAMADLQTLQDEASASADELAAATDRVTEASVASADARKGLADASAEVATMQATATGEQVESGLAADSSGAAMAGLAKKSAIAALGLGLMGAASVKMAADWEESTTQLVTGAGESAKSLDMLKSGILGLSVSTDTSVQQLTSGLYEISSAGYHGAAGLTVLKAAAEGAKEGGADLGQTANVLTSILNAYHLPASQATQVTSELIATVAAGKMHMQDLTTSLASVLPVAASAKISFAQVGGAVATMTMQGMTARRATMGLANMIKSLSNPSATASQEMADLGLNANTVASQLGSKGLTGTMSDLTEAILRNQKGGTVLASTFSLMSPAAQSIAEKITAGTISASQLTTAMDGLSPVQAKLVSQFDASATSATGLKQTFDAAMSKMVGGSTGLNVALLIGGKNAKDFTTNVKSIAGAAKGADSNVRGWALTTGDFNFKLGQAENAVKAVGYALGDALLPAATKVMSVVADLGKWFAQNKAAAIALAAVILGTLSFVIGGKLIKSLSEAKAAFASLSDSELLQAAASKVAAAGQWLLNAAMAANPALIIIAILAALVIAFYELWKHCAAFRDFWKDVWHGIETAAKAAWDTIRATFDALMGGIEKVADWVRSHWDEVADLTSRLVSDVIGFFERLPGDILHWVDQLFTGFISREESGIDNIVGFFRTGWDRIISDIHNWEMDVIDWVGRLFSDFISREESGIDNIVGFFKNGWDRIISDVHNWEVDVINWVEQLFTGFTGRVQSGLGNIVSWFEGLPGRILSALASLATDLFNFGAHIVSMLASGITSAVGDVTSAISHVGSEILDHIPHSPARKGPLSGSGSPDVAGRKIAQMLGQGMTSGLGSVTSAASKMARAAGLTPAGGLAGGFAGAAGATGAMQIELSAAGGTGPMQQLIRALWPYLQLEVRNRGGGGPNSVQIALGQTH